ncbi:MAG: adenylate/guanylate cyclase domain-containing protein, partial [Candidatus Binatia bacterium]
MIPSGTITFLFTDIEGSSDLWEHYPDAMQRVIARHDQLLRQVIEEHGGYVVKTTGDGFHAAFATATGALRAALAGQHALYAEPWDEISVLRVRMGLHTGAAEVRAGDYFGTAVNRAARLMGTGHGGQILLSTTTEALLRDAPSNVLGRSMEHLFRLRDLGEHRLKDLVPPERIFQVVSPDLPSEFPPLRTLTTRPNNLPPQS